MATVADAVTVTLKLGVENGNMKIDRSVTNLRFDQLNQGYVANVVLLASVPELLDMGDIVTAGWAWMRNLDDTNDIQIGAGDSANNFIALINLEPGEPFCGRLATSVPMAVSEGSAGASLEYIISEA